MILNTNVYCSFQTANFAGMKVFQGRRLPPFRQFLSAKSEPEKTPGVLDLEPLSVPGRFAHNWCNHIEFAALHAIMQAVAVVKLNLDAL